MKAFFNSFLFAFNGVRSSFLQQRNFKVQVGIAIITIAAGFYFNITLIEWSLILICIGFVLGLEIVNTSIENAVNLITTEWKPLAGKIKDMAAGAVLTASVVSLIVGVLVFKKYCVAETLASRGVGQTQIVKLSK